MKQSFQTSPFKTQLALIFGCFFFQLLLFVFSCFMFLRFCFMLALLLVCFSFVVVLFLYCFLFRFQPMVKVPCNSSVFLILCWLQGYYFICFVFLFLFVFFVFVCFQSKQWSCRVFCLCCLLSFLLCKKARFFLIASCGLVFCCFVLNVCFCFHSFEKDTKKKTRQPPPKKKNTPIFQLAQMCSQKVFLTFGVWV